MKEKRPHPTLPERRFTFYHQNEALLFQFLLHECLRAHQILKKKPDKKLLSKVIGKLENRSENWHAPHGHLPRLHHYCTLLVTHFDDPSSKMGKNLKTILERAFSNAQKISPLIEKEEKSLVELYTHLRKEMRACLKLLLNKVDQFHENASVLYFLLRHQEQIDAFYRGPIIQKKFRAFFPDGMLQAQKFLSEKFSKKGFHHLIPFIEQKMKQLDNE